MILEYHKPNPLKTYSLTLLLAWTISYDLAFLLSDNKTNWKWGPGCGSSGRSRLGGHDVRDCLSV